MYRSTPVLAIVSGSATLEISTQTLLSGDDLNEGDTLIVSANSICDLELKQSTDFRLFPDSMMKVKSLGRTDPKSIIIELKKGSLYLNKEKFKWKIN